MKKLGLRRRKLRCGGAGEVAAARARLRWRILGCGFFTLGAENLPGSASSGKRRPRRSWTSKIYRTIPSKRSEPTVFPVRMSSTQTPQSLSSTRFSKGMSLNRLDSRTCDRPTKAKGPARPGRE